jgi:hypothetical protein
MDGKLTLKMLRSKPKGSLVWLSLVAMKDLITI